MLVSTSPLDEAGTATTVFDSPQHQSGRKRGFIELVWSRDVTGMVDNTRPWLIIL